MSFPTVIKSTTWRTVLMKMIGTASLYLAFLLLFILAKPLFVYAQDATVSSKVSPADLCQIVWHGLPLDLATAAYLTAPVWLLVLPGIWLSVKGTMRLFNAYVLVLSLILSLIFVADACLYAFWDFKLDATVWTYLSQPGGALQSVTKAYAAGVAVSFVVAVFVVYATLTAAYSYPFALSFLIKPEYAGQLRTSNFRGPTSNFRGTTSKIRGTLQKSEDAAPDTQTAPAADADTAAMEPDAATASAQTSAGETTAAGVLAKMALTLLWLVVGGLLFLGIRGGVGKSTANVGMVYFSDRPFLNHAAVNPAFSLIASSIKAKDYGSDARFFEDDERRRILSTLHYSTESEDTPMLLNTTRPNVLVILMEGCGASFVHAVNPEADPAVTPHLNSLAAEGVVFTRCYANSFRTDRGTLCALSGFPSFPDVSVMKLPAKCATLPSIALSLREKGYSTEFLYGGDINFTDTNGYLLSTGYDRTYGDKYFPSSVRRTHDWGVTDAITFDTLYQKLLRYPTDRPWHTGFLTLASHEPWQVPYDRIANDPQANSMAYLDDCLGRFIEKFRQTPAWRNTLIIILPDHGIGYREVVADEDERKSHIPMIWTGGAVRAHRTVDVICNQTDLPATLLGQLGIDHNRFRFSRDVLSRTYLHPSAVHSWAGGIYYKDRTGISVLNLLTRPVSTQREEPQPSATRVNAAKALLQTFYGELKKK